MNDITLIVLIVATALAIVVSLQLRAHWPMMWLTVLGTGWLTAYFAVQAIQTQALRWIGLAIMMAVLGLVAAPRAWRAFKARE